VPGVSWVERLWFIPAGAGNTATIEQLKFQQAGSSPRARGTRALRQHHPLRIRFIPAGAGNTAVITFGPPVIAVHPRGRGEHRVDPSAASGVNGSSPRARGTRDAVPRRNFRFRFIPAGAGNTTRSRCRRLRWPVHPRGRGEHLRWPSMSARFTGSSPRARGTLGRFRRLEPRGRFIPAGAGNTSPTPAASSSAAVHPRGRGEHHESQTHQRAPRRFIPAGAGNTRTSAGSPRPRPVHPRGRGEH